MECIGRSECEEKIPWRPSDTTILSGAFYQDDYYPPSGFDFDRTQRDEPIMDNRELEGYNLDERLAAFVARVREEVKKQICEFKLNLNLRNL